MTGPVNLGNTLAFVVVVSGQRCHVYGACRFFQAGNGAVRFVRRNLYDCKGASLHTFSGDLGSVARVG
ncbi:MAG: hypothetical protein RLY31_2996 [Bacteroidota bacterium]